MVEGSGKDNVGHFEFTLDEFLQDAEAVESGHLNIEEDEIGVCSLMRLTASSPFLPWPMTEISGKALSRTASSSRAGFSSSTMMVLIAIVAKGKYSAGIEAEASAEQ